MFLAENAWEEIEIWTLAGLDLPRDWGSGEEASRRIAAIRLNCPEDFDALVRRLEAAI